MNTSNTNSKKIGERKICVIVATHKKYTMPVDAMYIPLHVGAEGKTDANGAPLNLGYIKDNTGENISNKNPGYCELTGLYWAWKNLNADYIGLVHYRRHFGKKRSTDLNKCVLKEKDIAQFTDTIRVFLPHKRHYYIETLYSHYAHTHYSQQLDAAKSIIKNNCPEYLESCNKVYDQKFGYMFNMFIMQRDLLNEYCSWIFPILNELETCIDTSKLSSFQARFYGRVSEILFNVWLDYQLKTGNLEKSEIKELPSFMTEKINWACKIYKFVRAKLSDNKYDKSF